jgi:glucosylceramidase
MALNTDGGPTNTGGGCSANPCRGVVTIDPKLPNGFLLNVDYYVLGQVGKVVEPGAFRIDSQTEGNNNIKEVAFLNPDKTEALILLNTNTISALKVKINWNKKSIIYSIDPGAVVSFKWK